MLAVHENFLGMKECTGNVRISVSTLPGPCTSAGRRLACSAPGAGLLIADCRNLLWLGSARLQ